MRYQLREGHAETEDGKNMQRYSQQLNNAIRSILQTNEEAVIDSFFTGDETISDLKYIKGLEDFELVTFIIIK